jgi:hypothetical protein
MPNARPLDAIHLDAIAWIATGAPAESTALQFRIGAIAMLESLRPAITLLFAVSCASCGATDTEVVFYSVNGHHFTWSERRAIEKSADAAATEVRRLLPALPARLTIRVQAGQDVIPETGETGSAHPPDVVYWTVDPNRSGGVATIVRAQLRGTLFHESITSFVSRPRAPTLT